MDDTISLRPQYLNKSNKWKKEDKNNCINDSNKTNNSNKTDTKNDVWGFYVNPHYDPVKEYIEQQPVYTKSQYDDTTIDVFAQVLPLQKHLLRGNEFKRIYFRNNNSVHYIKKNKQIQKEISFEEVKLEEELPVNDDIPDDESIFEDENEYYSDNENDYIDEYKDDFHE